MPLKVATLLPITVALVSLLPPCSSLETEEDRCFTIDVVFLERLRCVERADDFRCRSGFRTLRQRPSAGRDAVRLDVVDALVRICFCDRHVADRST